MEWDNCTLGNRQMHHFHSANWTPTPYKPYQTLAWSATHSEKAIIIITKSLEGVFLSFGKHGNFAKWMVSVWIPCEFGKMEYFPLLFRHSDHRLTIRVSFHLNCGNACMFSSSTSSDRKYFLMVLLLPVFNSLITDNMPGISLSP